MISFKEYFILLERKDLERNEQVNQDLDIFYNKLTQYYKKLYKDIFVDGVEDLEDWEYSNYLPPIGDVGLSIKYDSSDESDASFSWNDFGYSIDINSEYLYDLTSKLEKLIEDYIYPDEELTQDHKLQMIDTANNFIIKILKEYNDFDLRSILFHEYIHVLEMKYKNMNQYQQSVDIQARDSSKKQKRIGKTGKGSLGDAELKSYFNVEAEVNAYFQQFLNEILQMSNIKSLNFEEFKKVFMKKLFEYSEYHDFDYWDKLKSDNKKRILKRLYDAWVSMKK